jgi:hypothetical protein
MESAVEVVLEQLLSSRTLTSAAQVKSSVAPTRAEVPVLEAQVVDLREYDALLGGEERAS